MAKATGFITRNRKIKAKDFLFGLAFSVLDQKERSLMDITNDLECNVSKVGLHKKFTPKAVDFVKKVLSQLIDKSFNCSSLPNLKKLGFSQINIKDSTKISLPSQFKDQYPSYGGHNHSATSLLNIQFEFNLLNNSWKELKFTKVTQNDQSDSRDTLDDISSHSLNIRDLGYITMRYLKGVESKTAFYVNRLKKIDVFKKKVSEDGKKHEYEKLDWCELEKNDRKLGFSQIRDVEVYLGKEKFKTRLIIAPFPEKLKAERVRKAIKNSKRSKKSTQKKITDEHKAKLNYTLMITNVSKDKMNAETVIKTYSLRWQVELIFKAWKSNLKIDQIKAVNINRMKCELYCKLIFAFLSSHLVGKVNHHLIKTKKTREKQISQAKLHKFLRTKVYELKEAISHDFEAWVYETILPIIKKLLIEKRKGKIPSYTLINEVFIILS